MLIYSLGFLVVLLTLIIIRNRIAIARLQKKISSLTTEAKKEIDIDENKLYVGNVDYAASEAELAAHFAKFGQIEMVNIPVDRYSGRARGFGFVTFKKVKDAMRAMNLNGSEFKGRQIQVNFARERTAS